jgi:hypothetical protein
MIITILYLSTIGTNCSDPFSFRQNLPMIKTEIAD